MMFYVYFESVTTITNLHYVAFHLNIFQENFPKVFNYIVN
jgi:hypothetical protein